jgi:regulator of sigma E protease
MSIGVALLALAVLILLHEAGHFFVARAVGMRPRKFYVGFPPALMKTNRGGVEYGLGVIPLGGYVKLPGMHRAAAGDLRNSLPQEEQETYAPELDALDEALDRGDEDAARAELDLLRPHLESNRMFQEQEGSLSPDAYWRQDAWKRIVVIAAGPGVNILIAIVLFIAVFMVGTGVATRTIDQVESGHPAAAIGLRHGDSLVAINGHPVSADGIHNRINATHGRPFRLTIVRNGKRIVLGPVRARLDGGSYRIGIAMKVAAGPGESLTKATSSSFRLLWAVTHGTITGIAGLFVGKGTHDVSSSVGIVRDTAAAYRASLQDFFYAVGLISLALAVANMLPVLPLDGGHIVMSILEKVRGRAFSQLAYLRYSAVGISLFLFLMYFGLRNDLFSGGG